MDLRLVSALLPVAVSAARYSRESTALHFMSPVAGLISRDYEQGQFLFSCEALRRCNSGPGICIRGQRVQHHA